MTITATNDSFNVRALTSLIHQISLVSERPSNNEVLFDPHLFARSLVESDMPKIDTAVKSYLSLVAARSFVSSPDASKMQKILNKKSNSIQCNFGLSSIGSTDTGQEISPSRLAIVAARTLLATINSTTIPSLTDIQKCNSSIATVDVFEALDRNQQREENLQKEVIRILWNGLVHASNSYGNSTKEEKKRLKPSILLGKKSLIFAYPYVMERFRRGKRRIDTELDVIVTRKTEDVSFCSASDSQEAMFHHNPLHQLTNEVMPPVSTPEGMNETQWEAYYTEFGNLLKQACSADSKDSQSSNITSSEFLMRGDCALLWTRDQGVNELQYRREKRMQRASDALVLFDERMVDDEDILTTEAVDSENTTSI